MDQLEKAARLKKLLEQIAPQNTVMPARTAADENNLATSTRLL